MNNNANAKRESTFPLMIDCLKTAYRLDRTAVILTVLESLLGAVEPYIAIFLSAYVVDGLSAGINFKQLIWTAIIGVCAIFLVKCLEGLINRKKEVHIEICVRKFDMQLGKKTLSVDFEQLESPKINDLRARMRNDRQWGAGFYSVFWQLSWLLASIFSLTAALVVLLPLLTNGDFFASWTTPLFLVALISITLFAAVFNASFTNKKIFALMDERAKRKSIFYYFVYGGMDYKAGKDVRIFDAGPMIQEKFGTERVWIKSWIKRFTSLTGFGGLVAGSAAGILQGGAYLFVVLRAAEGALTVGSVLKYAATVYNFVNNFSDLINAFSQFAVTAKRQQSRLEYINIPDVLFKGTLPVEKRSDNEYEIEFKNVSFQYPSSDNYALYNVSLKLRIGERMAVVGMNGSGKTTFIKLLCRLYDPTEGEILLNGIDIKKYDYNEYLSIFSVVFQDFKLFSFSLGQNVAATVDYDKAKAESSLAQAGFGARYDEMEFGTETCLYKGFDEKGVEISGGEAQKIALARALYKNAPFIVLDEPTAALDPIAEFEVYSKFNEIVGSKTAIYISHRLSSCRFCDDIAVFHEGRIVQRGSHNALVADERGKYHELWYAQAQYYAENEAC